MLTDTSTQVATNLSEILVGKNVKLIPKTSTLVQELCANVEPFEQEVLVSKEVIPLVLQEVSNGNIENKKFNPSSHDAVMDNYINDLTSIVSNHINFARGTVNKEISAFIDKVTTSLNNYSYRNVEDFFDVTYYTLPKILTGFFISEEISDYSHDDPSKYMFEHISLNVIKDADFDLFKYLLVGHEEEDRHILEWLNFLGKGKVGSYLLDDIMPYALTNNELIDYALVNFLFYRNLTLKTDLNVGLSTIQLKTISARNRDYFAMLTAKALFDYERNIRQELLIPSISGTKFTFYNESKVKLTVYQESFDKLVEKGGNIELILSYISINSDTKATVKELIDNAEEYMAKWNSTKSLYYAYLNNTKIDTFKTVISDILSKLDTKEEEQEIISKDASYVSETNRLYNEYIEKLTVMDLEDIEKIALDLIAKIKFRFSSAHLILSEMKSLLDKDENIKTHEAALYSSVKYIVDFLLKQVSVTTI
jgi:hypothetical protein